MNSINSALLRRENSLANRLLGGHKIPDDYFATLLGNQMSKQSTGSGVQGILDRLSQRFPNISFVPKTDKTDKTDKTEKEETTSVVPESDKDEVEIDETAAAEASGSDTLTKMLEDIVAALLDRNSDSNLMNFGGNAFTYRRVSITITTVSYSEQHYANGSSELLGSSDLRASFQDRLAEMLQEFFGAKRPEETATGTADAEKTDKTATTDKDWSGGFAAGFWSMELFYSQSYISSFANAGDGAVNSASWNYSASFSASFAQGFTSFLMPQALSGMNGGGLQSMPSSSRTPWPGSDWRWAASRPTSRAISSAYASAAIFWTN